MFHRHEENKENHQRNCAKSIEPETGSTDLKYKLDEFQKQRICPVFLII